MWKIRQISVFFNYKNWMTRPKRKKLLLYLFVILGHIYKQLLFFHID